jgi:hypothetical protein
MRPVLLLLLLHTACGCSKSDAQRAGEEREAIKQRMSKSLVLWPYPLLKLAVRSSSSPTRPEAIGRLAQMLAELKTLPEEPKTLEDSARLAAGCARLSKRLYDARGSLKDHDEDSYPTLWEVAYQQPPWNGATLGIAAYDSNVEHLLLAALWLAADVAGHKVPVSGEILLYEVSRATPSAGWDPFLEQAARLLRGASFCSAGYHWAAEEELTAYLKNVDPVRASPFLSVVLKVEGARSHEALAVGYLLRAWNRHELGRKKPSEEDLEKGLQELKAAGIENEATQWGWVVLYARRGQSAEAAAELEALANALAARPLEATAPFDPAMRDELLQTARQMRENGKGLPVLLEARMTLRVLEAALVRLGGVEAVLSGILSPEDSATLHEYLERMRQLRKTIGALDAPHLDEAGKSLAELGKRKLDWVKTRLTASDAGAQP